MIRVTEAKEPPDFKNRVTIPGLRAIAEMVGEKPARPAGRRFKKRKDKREDISSEDFPSYWTEALDDLMQAYNQICAYSCFRIHEVTGWRSVDHFAAKSQNWDKAYQWSNYRLVSGPLNSRKSNYSDVSDPFEIIDGWFQLELVGFQVIPDQALKSPIRQKIQDTIDRLGLNDFRRSREVDAENYWAKDVSLRALENESPFVAKELRRQGRLNPEDVR